MKIQTVTAPSPAGEKTTGPSEVHVVEFSGPFDATNEIIKRARELVAKSGSETMIRSFDKSLKKFSPASDDTAPETTE